MNIALAHDTLVQQGGAERVLNSFHQLFPNAPVFTVAYDPLLKEKYAGWDIRTSQLQTLYLGFPKLQYLMPLIPPSVDKLDFTGFDVVLSSSSSFVKNIRVPKTTTHICYCHTPTRFLWHDHSYLGQELPWFLKPFTFVARWYLKQMKKWDFAGAQRVNYFIANSKEVQKRIKEYYNRDSVVIYPGVDVNFWKPTIPKCHCEECIRRGNPSSIVGEQIASPFAKASADKSDALAMTEKKHYFLLAGRLQAHKHNDFVVKIFNELKLPLHVVGTGRQEEYLKSIAKPNITFLGKLSDEKLRDEYSGALAYIFPQEEDFGLMPLEAAACGTATIALSKAGALETVVPGETGEFFNSYNHEEVKSIITNWDPGKYTQTALKAHAEKFSDQKFKEEISGFINTQVK